MKSKDVWTIPLAVATLLLVFAGALSYTQRVRVRGDLSALLPEAPAAVLRIPALRERLPHLLQSAPYQQLRQAAVWQELIAPLTKSLHNLKFDPMRVIGADALISLHQRPDSGGIPAVLVLSRIDWLAKKAEQIAYVFDCFSGKIGIRVAQSGGADASDPGLRYRAGEFTVRDNTLGSETEAVIEVGRLQLRIPAPW